VPEPTGIPQLDNLDQELLGLMIRHDQLRPFLSSIITERELEPQEFSEADLQKSSKIYYQRHQLKSKEDIQRHCQKHGFTQREFLWQVQLQDRIINSSHKRFSHKAEQHYLTRKEQYDQVTYTQIVLNDEYHAQEFYLRIKEDDATFHDLAREVNRQSSRQFQWRIGPVPIARIPKPLAKILQSVKPGALLEPVQVQSNWLVARLEEFKPTQYDRAMEQNMCLDLFQKHVNQLVDEQIETIASRRNPSSTPTTH